MEDLSEVGGEEKGERNMRLVKPSTTILDVMGFDYGDSLKLIEQAGRTCYKSETKITKDSSKEFVARILKSDHQSVIEHSAMSVRFIIDRGVSHELVRHRLCAFSQESTRYCNYKGGVTFVIPPWINIDEGEYKIPTINKNSDPSLSGIIWMQAMLNAEDIYIDLIKGDWSPQQARSVLPNSLKTEIVVTANFREWRHIFMLRTAKTSHPQMREVMIPLLMGVKTVVPEIFDDIVVEEEKRDDKQKHTS